MCVYVCMCILEFRKSGQVVRRYGMGAYIGLLYSGGICGWWVGRVIVVMGGGSVCGYIDAEGITWVIDIMGGSDGGDVGIKGGC